METEDRNFNSEGRMDATTEIRHDHDGTLVPMERVGDFGTTDSNARFRCPECKTEITLTTTGSAARGG